MCARKMIVDSDEEEEEAVETILNTKEASSVHIGAATSSFPSNNRNEEGPFLKPITADQPKGRRDVVPLLSGLR